MPSRFSNAHRLAPAGTSFVGTLAKPGVQA
eukprot:ctg_4813.g668